MAKKKAAPNPVEADPNDIMAELAPTAAPPVVESTSQDRPAEAPAPVMREQFVMSQERPKTLAELRAEARWDRGLVCGKCECQMFKVVYTRPGANNTVSRCRECVHCGKRIWTVEAPIG